MASNSEALIDLVVDAKEAYARAYSDINFFASLALPSICIHPLPYFYISIWQILVNRKEADVGKLLRFALGLPRGHAKTTFVKLLIAWLIAYDKISFALIVGATDDLAQEIISDISDILGSENMEAVYGVWTDHLLTDSKDLKKLVYHRRPVTLVARGVQSGMRGLNIKHTRPDFILLDDAQTRENDESPTDSAKLLRTIVATILKLFGHSGNRWIVYIGNMYSENCILYKLKENPGWISLITGAILENGEPLWPELVSLQDLKDSFKHDEALGLADLWFAELMNDPKAKGVSLLNNTLPECPYNILDPGFLADGVFITIDPAGFRDASDDNQIVVHYVFNNVGIIAETNQGIFKPDELIKEALRLALQHGASLIAVEDVGYQQTLGFWLQHFCNEYGITDIHIVPVNPHGRSKEARIRQFVAELETGNYFHGTPETRAAFMWQASQYKLKAKKNKDDLLDAEAYGLDVRNDYWALLTNLKHRKELSSTVAVLSNNTPIGRIQ